MDICPKKAADVRGDSPKSMADFEMGGRPCVICNQADHTEEHHRLAVADLLALAGQRMPKSPAGARRANDPALGSPETGGPRKCRFCEDCRQWKKGGRSYAHDTDYADKRRWAGGDSRQGQGRGKSGGDSDKPNTCFQCGKLREDHPDKHYCPRDAATAVQPVEPQTPRGHKGGGRQAQDNKKEVTSTAPKGDSSPSSMGERNYLGYEEIIYARATGASTSANHLRSRPWSQRVLRQHQAESLWLLFSPLPPRSRWWTFRRSTILKKESSRNRRRDDRQATVPRRSFVLVGWMSWRSCTVGRRGPRYRRRWY